MNKKQKQLVESFARAQVFLDAYPVQGTLSATVAREQLDDAVQKLRAYAGTQHNGRDNSRMELRRQEDQIAQLVDQFIRPIVTIARAQVEPDSDKGLPGGLRMPKLPQGPTKLLAICDGMIASARPYEALFVANGMPADFLAQFTSARDTLERVMHGRELQVRSHVAARAGLAVQLRRGRRAMERLDAIVRASFRNDPVALTAWRGAKRVFQVPGGAGARVTEDSGETLRAA